MIRGLAISHSGLRFARERLRSSAHNTANATTDETVSLRTRGREHPSAGVPVELEFGSPRQRVAEAVEQLVAVQHFASGVRSVQTQDQMLGALLDIEN